jgi:hypothetical protein
MRGLNFQDFMEIPEDWRGRCEERLVRVTFTASCDCASYEMKGGKEPEGGTHLHNVINAMHGISCMQENALNPAGNGVVISTLLDLS